MFWSRKKKELKPLRLLCSYKKQTILLNKSHKIAIRLVGWTSFGLIWWPWCPALCTVAEIFLFCPKIMKKICLLIVGPKKIWERNKLFWSHQNILGCSKKYFWLLNCNSDVETHRYITFVMTSSEYCWIVLFDSCPKCFCLKVSKFQKQFMVSQKTNMFILWENWGHNNLLLRLSDL